MTTAASRRAYAGPTLFSFGFRPFFLFGSIWSAMVVPLWMWSFLGGGPAALTLDWHVHEMLFGFLAAIMAGFLTTAVPNWTGRMPIIGLPLVGLISLWVAGRLAMLAQSTLGPVAAVIDSAFLVVFAGVLWREVLAGRNWRNLPVCVLISVMALGNIAFHVGVQFSDPRVGERVALGVAVVLITLIGGRIVPSFTRNWMKGRGITALPAESGRFDQGVMAITIIAAAAWAAFPDARLTGAALLLAGATNLARLARWRGWATLAEPLVTILHVGYLWLGLGLALLGGSALWPAIPRTAGVHALTAGAVGVMTLAVMTRATRGHSGRPIAAGAATTAIFITINAATLVRIAAPFGEAAQPGLLALSATLWALAFGGFAVAYGPMLTRRFRPATV
ncbi:MAG: NnrS family protein [Caulobacter sp.]|nr:NnrS family protein [Caulobacter sp.]